MILHKNTLKCYYSIMLSQGDSMKKHLLFSLVILSYLLNANISLSQENIVVPEMINETQEENVVLISDKYTISEQDGKFAIVDVSTGKNKLGILAESIELFDEDKQNEYKIKFRNDSTNKLLTGYFNTDTDQILITNYDEMFLNGDLIKVKEDSKFGLINKDGHTILMPIFDKLNLFTQENKQYIYTKLNNKSSVYTIDGNIIPEEDLYSISYDGVYAIAADLKPVFKKYAIENKKSNYLKSIGYQVEEVKAPDNVQVASVVENVIDTELKENVTEEVNNIKEEIQQDSANTKTILIGKKHYIIKEIDGLLGLYTIDGKEILPITYNKLSITNLKNPIILAENDEELSAFNISGKLIGNKTNDLISTYRFGKTYIYKQNENVWNLLSKDKLIGTLEFVGEDYKFTKSKYNLFRYNRLNDIFMALNNN